MMKVLFLEGKGAGVLFHDGTQVECNPLIMTTNDRDFHGDGSGILHSDGNLRDDVRGVRGSVNDGGFSHGDDENEENDDVRESDDDDGVRSVRICEDSRDSGNQVVSDDDESGGRIGDDDN